MPLVIVPEDGTGLPNANSYISQAEGDAYFEAHLYGDSWTNASTEDKDKAMAHATRLLDAHTNWRTGSKKTANQALQWPREGAYKDGFEISPSVVPVEVKNATAELAMLMISNNLTADVDQNNLNSITLGKGALEIEFNDSRPKRQIPFHVDALLQGLGSIQGGGNFTQVDAYR